MSYLAGFIEESTVDGKGIRNTIFISGCTHNCKGCHNKEAQNFKFGEEITDEIIDKIINLTITNDLVDGITLSGGDPLHPNNVDTSLKIMVKYYEEARKHDIPYSVWMYTGYLIEDLIKRKDPKVDSILRHLDMLVDGPFIEKLRDPMIDFAGSSNQRFLNEDTLRKYLGGYII